MESSEPVDFAGAERRTTPVELFWDLAFVFAITQVTHFLLFHLTWGGFLRGMIVLALVWWAWSAVVWAANAQAEDSATMQLALLTSLVLIFVAGIAVPGAFGEEATLFALTYSGVRLIHLTLYVDASRRGNASWEAIAGFGAATLAALAHLLRRARGQCRAASAPNRWRRRPRRRRRLQLPAPADRRRHRRLRCRRPRRRRRPHRPPPRLRPPLPLRRHRPLPPRHAAFRMRMVGEVNRFELAAAAAAMIVYLVGGSLDAWLSMAMLAAVLLALSALELRPSPAS